MIQAGRYETEQVQFISEFIGPVDEKKKKTNCTNICMCSPQ